MNEFLVSELLKFVEAAADSDEARSTLTSEEWTTIERIARRQKQRAVSVIEDRGLGTGTASR